MLAGILGVKRALAVADAGDKGAAGLLAKDIAVRPAGSLEGVFDGPCKPHGNRAEEAVPRLLDLLHGEGALVLCLRRNVALAGRHPGALRGRLVGPAWPVRAVGGRRRRRAAIG